MHAAPELYGETQPSTPLYVWGSPCLDSSSLQSSMSKQARNKPETTGQHDHPVLRQRDFRHSPQSHLPKEAWTPPLPVSSFSLHLLFCGFSHSWFLSRNFLLCFLECLYCYFENKASQLPVSYRIHNLLALNKTFFLPKPFFDLWRLPISSCL